MGALLDRYLIPICAIANGLLVIGVVLVAIKHRFAGLIREFIKIIAVALLIMVGGFIIGTKGGTSNTEVVLITLLSFAAYFACYCGMDSVNEYACTKGPRKDVIFAKKSIRQLLGLMGLMSGGIGTWAILCWIEMLLGVYQR